MIKLPTPMENLNKNHPPARVESKKLATTRGRQRISDGRPVQMRGDGMHKRLFRLGGTFDPDTAHAGISRKRGAKGRLMSLVCVIGSFKLLCQW